MPKSEKLSSNVPADQQESDSVFDFLYQDARRVGSCLAQLNPGGLVQSVKQQNLTEETGGVDASVSAGANAIVARAGTGLSTRYGNTNRDSIERTFDPFWTNAVDLLNLLESRQLLHRDITSAGIGKFVLVTGRLGIIDFSQLKLVWDIPELRALCEKSIADGLGPSDAALTFFPKHKNNKEQAAKAFAKLIVTVFQSLPETIQGRLSDGNDRLFYFTLNDAGLVSSPTELLLKHGLAIGGEWSIMGILDALPGPRSFEEPGVVASLGLEGNPLTILLGGMQGILQQAGKPDEAYGLSPLLIFRSAGD